MTGPPAVKMPDSAQGCQGNGDGVLRGVGKPSSSIGWNRGTPSSTPHIERDYRDCIARFRGDGHGNERKVNSFGMTIAQNDRDAIPALGIHVRISSQWSSPNQGHEANIPTRLLLRGY